MAPLWNFSLVDWGPNTLDGSAAPPLRFFPGAKSNQLRREVRRQCPGKPGVYGMVDGHGELIYVGKAKHLRGRLLSYFRRGKDRRSGRIVGQARGIAWEVWPSEFAALLRELELIRRWRPRWNVQGQPLRRRFTHVCLGRAPAPHVFLSRRIGPGVIASFGPIPLGPRARDAVRRLNDCLGLRDCPDKQEMIFAGQKELFPIPLSAGCIRHEIGTCLGPCLAACTESEYGRRARAARAFLAGTDSSLLDDLDRDMQKAAAGQQFERAAGLRDRLESLRWLHDRLQRLQHLRARESFVYPVAGSDGRTMWYLIHAGRTIAALPAPADPDSRRAAGQLIDTIYHKKNSPLVLDSHEHHDGMLLVSAWFRKYPEERKKVIKPARALK